MEESLDFSKFFKPEEKPKENIPKKRKKLRKNFSVGKCCGNCKFYWFRKSMEIRGWCKLDNLKLDLPKYSRDKETADRNWARVHITNVCKSHEFSKIAIKTTEDWTGEKIDGKNN